MEAKVSVIMPSLNVVKYIDECVTSVLNQTLKDIEIICVDAGSDDGTYERLMEYKSNNSRMRVLHSDVRSYGAQVNMGINQANGEYVCIVETDDYVDLNMLERLYDLAKIHSLDYIKAGANSIQQFGERVLKRKMVFADTDYNIYDKVVSIEEYPQILLMDCYIWRGIYKRQFLLDNSIYCSETNGAAYQDIGFTHLVTVNAKRAMFIDEPFYQYRKGRNESSSKSPNGVKYTYNEYKRLIGECGYLNKLPEAAADKFWRRFAKAVLCEVNHILRITDYDLNTEHISLYYDWFQEMFSQNIIKSVFFESIFSENERTEVNLFATDFKAYVELIHKNDMLLQKNNSNMINAAVDSQVVIFGCGTYGLCVLETLYDNDLEAAGFCDNNEKLWGTKKADLPVNSPEYMVSRYPEAVYIVANKKHADDIERELRQLNVKKIIIYKRYEE